MMMTMMMLLLLLLLLPWIRFEGVETTKASVDRHAFNERRCDILRLLLACLSRPLYHQPARLDVRADVWASYFVCECRFVAPVSIGCM